MKALVVTEDRLFADSLCELIRSIEGSAPDTHCCSSAMGSIRLASHYGVDALFVDHLLPDYERVIKAVRFELPRTVIVLVTEGEGKGALIDALTAGARDYLARQPLTRKSVERVLWSVLPVGAVVPADRDPLPVPTQQKVAFANSPPPLLPERF